MALSKASVSKFAFCYSLPFLYNENEYSLCAHTVTDQSTLGCFWPNVVSSAVLVAAVAVVVVVVVVVIVVVVVNVVVVVFVVIIVEG